MKILLISLALAICCAAPASTAVAFEKDLIPTATGELEITFIGHGSLMLQLGDRTIHIDPYSKVADYANLPKADLILITHEHQDHLDLEALQKVRSAQTVVVLTPKGSGKIADGMVMQNGERRTVAGVEIEAVPAYNLLHKRENGQPFHPRGEGNGYILTFGTTRLYIAGDSENTPEMKALGGIDVAFLPMNLPYTMTPEMVADAAKAFTPRILYPYHYGESDPARLATLLKATPEIEVRIRNMR